MKQPPPMSQTTSVTQLELHVEFLTPTPVRPTRPCGEVGTSRGDFHSHLRLRRDGAKAVSLTLGSQSLKTMPGSPFSAEIFYLVPILKVHAEGSHKVIGVLRVKHYFGKETSNMFSRFDNQQKFWGKDKRFGENGWKIILWAQISTVKFRQLRF